MKNILLFLIGLITGAILLFLISLIVANTVNEENDVILFSEPGECISQKKFKVFQVIEEGMALASELSDVLVTKEIYGGMIVVFYTEGKYYYDEEIIKVPKNNCVKQIGIYTYQNNSKLKKTVPIVTVTGK